MNKTLVRKVMEWNDKKFSELQESDDKHKNLKAFGHGSIEGYIEAAAIWYIPVLIAAYYWKHQAKKK